MQNTPDCTLIARNCILTAPAGTQNARNCTPGALMGMRGTPEVMRTNFC